MKRACLSVFLAVWMASGSLAFCQTTAIDGCSPQVQERERQLLQGLTTEQVLLLNQNTALFEQMPDPGLDPHGALQGLLSAPGIKGMKREEAVFAILAIAGRHLDEDLREIAGGINALNESRQLVQAALAKIHSAGISPVLQGDAAAAGKKGERALPAAGTASGPLKTTALAGQAMRTTHYKIEYCRVVPLVLRSIDGMSSPERLAEAGLLTARQAELDGLVAEMTERSEHAKLRRQQLIQALEGMAQTMPGKLGRE